jgi:hypothetical protein
LTTTSHIVTLRSYRESRGAIDSVEDGESRCYKRVNTEGGADETDTTESDTLGTERGGRV